MENELIKKLKSILQQIDELSEHDRYFKLDDLVEDYLEQLRQLIKITTDPEYIKWGKNSISKILYLQGKEINYAKL